MAPPDGPVRGVSAPWLTRAVATALACLFLLFVIRFAWTGYVESDDAYYAAAAHAWAFHFPYLGDSHWSLRHAIVLPMALMFRLFGEHEWTLETPMLLYYAALLLLTGYGVGRIGGWGTGLIAAVLLGAVPVLASGASIVFDDVQEAFFVMASLWAFFFATSGRRTGLFVLSGVMAGCGFITRETTSALLVAYGILFLVGYGGRRLGYVWMGIGFLLVAGIDTGLLWHASGDPLYRLHVSLRGVHGDNPSMAADFLTPTGLDRFGDLAAPRWAQAPLILFVGQNFGLLFWIAVPATLALAADRAASQARRAARLFGFAALVWFAVLSYVFFFLWLVPRYQIVTAAALVGPLAVWLARLGARRGWLMPGLIVVALLCADLGLIALSDRQPLWGERALVAYAADHPGPVFTDPATLRGAAWLLQIRGLAGRVRAVPPPPGALYYFDSHPSRGIPPDWPVQRPAAEWVPAAQFAERPALGAVLVHALWLRGLLPVPILRKLDPAPRTATVYQVPPAA